MGVGHARLGTLTAGVARWVLYAFVAAVPATLPLWAGAYLRSFASIVLMWVGLALAWNLISGYTGYVSFGHTAFFGFGGYVGAVLAQRYGVPWLVAGTAAAITTGLLAIPVGRVFLRLRGPFFAIGMLGLSEVIRISAARLDGITGGGAGLYLTTTSNLWLVYYGFFAIAGGALILTLVVDRSRFGASLLAIRDDEDAASVVGVQTTSLKTAAFVISAAITAALGVCYATFVSYIDPNSIFNVELNILIILMAALGGVGTVVGPVIGALIVGGLREYLWIRLPILHMVGFGLGMVATVLIFPNGLVPYVRGILGRRRRRDIEILRRASLPKTRTTEAMRDDRTRDRHDPARRVTSDAGNYLEIRSVTKTFAGRQVLSDCSIEVRHGTITGLIGPNGSGKTTIFNIVSGLLSPDSGTIRLNGRDVTRLRPHQRAHLGLARTFQLPRLFNRLSVSRNLSVAGLATRHGHIGFGSRALLEFGIADLAEEPVSELSYGQRKLVEIARAFEPDPEMVLMDEPLAGVNPVLRSLVKEAIHQRNLLRGTTFLVIGHEMEDMFDLCDEIIVLDQGRVLARGIPDEIRSDARVFKAYFGSWRETAPYAPGAEASSPDLRDGL